MAHGAHQPVVGFVGQLFFVDACRDTSPQSNPFAETALDTGIPQRFEPASRKPTGRLDKPGTRRSAAIWPGVGIHGTQMASSAPLS
jgi:hypothetical protein